MKSKYLLLILINLASIRLYANWEQCNGPYGAEIVCLEVSGSNIYAGSKNGLFKSSDFGKNWASAGLAGNWIHCIAVSGNKIFAGTNEGIHFSMNNGIDWTNIKFPGHNTISLEYSMGTLIAVISNYSELFFSIDDGNTWEKKKIGDNTELLCCLSVSGTNIITGTLGGDVYLTSDFGDNWRKMNIETEYSDFRFLDIYGNRLVASTTDGELYISHDNGYNWTQKDVHNKNHYIVNLVISGSII